MPEKTVEAHIKLPDGTEINVKGSKEHVKDILSSVTKTPRAGDSGAGGAGSAGRGSAGGGKLTSVAEKDEGGAVHMIASDLKAKNAKDAAHRLIYLTLLARRELLTETKTSRKIVVDILRSYGLYDGNVRGMIIADKTLIKPDRKTLGLAVTAVPTAWTYVRQLQDDSVKGQWKPTGPHARRSSSKKTKSRVGKSE